MPIRVLSLSSEEFLARTAQGPDEVVAEVLELFIEQKLVSRTFRDADQLSDTLVEWPTFYLEVRGNYPDTNWRRLYFDGGDLICVDTGDPEGDFVMAHTELTSSVADHLLQRIDDSPSNRDAPYCPACAIQMQRAGTGFACPSCGATTGFD